ncbi:cyanophycinase [Flavobacterium sp. CLA17]|uniref:cyanophycinase n=1 Tax=Flavobacterium sp. CLA17 TaxID=2724135 RepID=UPI0014915DE8|nr:cyanophycinase [Flavobacterium sp. CLA17]QSB28798.1 cyanophycinase [Flavobacterium sp. CLA17]
MKTAKFLLVLLTLIGLSCKSAQKSYATQNNFKKEKNIRNTSKGKLFIIGGGKKSKLLLQELINVSGLKEDNFIALLPMASEEPDSAAYYAKKEFVAIGINPDKIKSFNFKKELQSKPQIDSLKKATLIYITGGDQNLFMDKVLHTSAYNAIHEAYKNGATIAGTSAGAAVMSHKMITGIEHKHPRYTGEFKTIEAGNFEIKEGLGLLPSAIIDQHFIYRMRMNRLLAVALENPDKKAIGIDESTAIIVQGDSAMVTGLSQVILLENLNKESIKTRNGLLGGKNINVNILLPGDKFKL